MGRPSMLETWPFAGVNSFGLTGVEKYSNVTLGSGLATESKCCKAHSIELTNA